jgi:hypothetical protein
MNITLVLCALIICLFGGYAEPCLPERQKRARRDEMDRVQRVRDRHPYRPVNRSTRRLP